MRKLNFSILCAGHIAETMAGTVVKMDEVVPYAVAARDLNRASRFAEKYGFQKAYGSYEDLVNDANVDLVYVASPHSLHYEHAKLCLMHGKHVLCEKPMTVNAKQAEELFRLAKERNLFIMEAVWTRFQPFAAKLREVLDGGAIGDLHTMLVTFGQDLRHVNRLVSPELAGGALLDLGIYPITFASMFFGTKVKQIESAVVKTEQGVDGQNSITLVYEDGRMAILNSCFLCSMKNQGIIYGNGGRLEVDSFWHPQEFRVYRNGESEPETYEAPFDFTGYEYEVRAAAKAIAQGELECSQMPQEETLRVMKIMDQLRADWNIKYPFE
ncbi:MAG TPA: Gfo/Idh/MocA family oxidoreductase [Caproiciproducens sp.]|nr:Gfo/Idh/MocA family oxidoreductase [Caproiciproducens sp.]